MPSLSATKPSSSTERRREAKLPERSPFGPCRTKVSSSSFAFLSSPLIFFAIAVRFDAPAPIDISAAALSLSALIRLRNWPCGGAASTGAGGGPESRKIADLWCCSWRCWEISDGALPAAV